MSPFWGSLFEHLRGCGRSATLFLFALAGFLGLVVLLAIIACQSELRQFILHALPWLSLPVAAWICVAIRRACVRRRERLLRSPLSDDELRVARLKLRKPRG